MDGSDLKFTSQRDEHLFALQLRVAQRADELRRILGKSAGQSFELWRQAESETWTQISSDERSLREFRAMSALAE